jgi:nicotinamidase-related amidase
LGHNIANGLNVEKDDFVVEKQTYDAFTNDDFDKILEDEDIDNVVLVGTLVNVCVMHTASSAALNDYRAIVLEDLVGYIEESDKEYALQHIDWLFGEVKNSDDFLDEIN